MHYIIFELIELKKKKEKFCEKKNETATFGYGLFFFLLFCLFIAEPFYVN